MAETPEVGDEQLALLLQVSRDFAFQQLAEAGGFLPFATQAKPDGELEFVRVADERTEEAVSDIFDRLRLTMTERARQGEVIGVATVANILAAGSGIEVDPEFDRAIRVHVEAEGFSRVVIAPYRVEEADEESNKPYLVDAKMVAFEATPEIFAA